MHPHYYLSLFPPYPREPVVFVAMSFAPDMRPRYDRVIAPAIARLQVDGVALRAHRVDATVASDAVLDEILHHISHSTLVLADISTVTVFNDRPLRNQNVLYEVGLAHAVRQPLEVLLLRSDNDTLNFDLTGIRVHSYDPEGNPDEAARIVADLAAACISQVDHTKSSVVAKVAASLDLPAWMLVMNSYQQTPPRLPSSFGDIANDLYTNAAQARLLELGVFETIYRPQFDSERPEARAIRLDETLTYRLTAFGGSVLAYGAQSLVITSERLTEWRTQRRTFDPSTGAAGG